MPTPLLYNTVPLFADVPTTNPFFPHIDKMEGLGMTDGWQPGHSAQRIQFPVSDGTLDGACPVSALRSQLQL